MEKGKKKKKKKRDMGKIERKKVRLKQKQRETFEQCSEPRTLVQSSGEGKYSVVDPMGAWSGLQGGQ